MISVIVPVYNAQAYLSDMIDSVLSQKFAEWELLLIVSKSEDDSLEICQSYAKKTSKIRVIEMPGGSAGMARNILCLSMQMICYRMGRFLSDFIIGQ